MKLIVAVDLNYWIWKDNWLVWSLKWDMNFFKEKTLWKHKNWKRNIVLMWRKTYESIPEKFRPLKDRINFVITKNKEKSKYFDTKNFHWPYYFDSLDKWLFNSLLLRKNWIIDEVFIIWWSSIYEEMINNNWDLLETIYLTRIFSEFDCDSHIKTLDNFLKKEFIEKNKSEIFEEKQDNWEIIKYQFIEFIKKWKETN